MMIRQRYLRMLMLVFALASQAACAQAIKCEVDNENLRLMPKSLVTFTRTDGSQFEVEVKTADNNRTRAAGFQRVCASTIAAEPILFVFGRPFRASFHMNNVMAGIDIAFFDQAGKIESIQAMKPYVSGSLKKPTYAPSKPVVGALEAYPGFFQEHNIDTTTSLTWAAQ